MAQNVQDTDNGWSAYMNQFQDRPLTLVAVGKTGEGKSATLNSLRNWATKRNENYFHAGEGPESVTDKVMECDISPPRFPKCRLIDTIGLFDTKLTSKQKHEFRLNNKNKYPLDEEHRLVLQQFTQIMEMCKDGIDAFLFVAKPRHRATREENETIDVIFRYLGWNMLNYVIFVATEKNLALESSFQEWRKHICELLEERGFPKETVEDRFIFVDNKNPTDEQCYQLLALVKFVSQINRGCPYTPVAFQEAQRQLEIEKKKIKEQLEKEFQREVDKQIKPIEQRHQAKIDNLQEQINKSEVAAQKLRAGQLVEREKFKADIEAMQKAQTEERKSMEEESKRQMKLLEQQKQQEYENRRNDITELTKMMGEIMKSNAQFNQQFLQAIQELKKSQKSKWWECLPVVGPFIHSFLPGK